jgi:hypothetical protein
MASLSMTFVRRWAIVMVVIFFSAWCFSMQLERAVPTFDQAQMWLTKKVKIVQI